MPLNHNTRTEALFLGSAFHLYGIKFVWRISKYNTTKRHERYTCSIDDKYN